MIVYPEADYNSFISFHDAETYFTIRLHASKYLSADPADVEAALTTAFMSICEMDLTIDPEDLKQMKALKDAQCEQALHELRTDLDFQKYKSFAIDDVKFAKTILPRHSPRAVAILRPYLKAPVIQVVR